MKIYVVDAFAEELFKGNQAGIVLLDKEEAFPPESFMKSLAAELKHSETAFVKQTGEDMFDIRYFTPEAEVELCGHATIASFAAMRDTGRIHIGEYRAGTLAGELAVSLERRMVWMDMAEPEYRYEFSARERGQLYDAYGLDLSSAPGNLVPGIVSTGLCDILLPVKDRESLYKAVMDQERVAALSKQYRAVGIHMFCLGGSDGGTAYCRNFAPLVGIPEESATGTSNGALTYYLRRNGIIEDGAVNTFVQGETMGKESRIYTRITGEKIRVGGSGKLCMECSLCAGECPWTIGD